MSETRVLFVVDDTARETMVSVAEETRDRPVQDLLAGTRRLRPSGVDPTPLLARLRLSACIGWCWGIRAIVASMMDTQDRG